MRRLVEQAKHRVGHEAREQQARLDAVAARKMFHVVAGERLHRAHHHELPTVTNRGRKSRPRAEQALEVLAVVHSRRVEHETIFEACHRGARGLERLAARHRRPVRLRRGRADHDDLLLRQMQSVDGIVGGRLGYREHDVGRAHELEPSPVATAQTGIGQVTIGIDLGDQVVERHRQPHPTRGGARRPQPVDRNLELERRAEMQQARPVVAPATQTDLVAVLEPTARDERLNRARRAQIRIHQEAVHQRRMATPQRSRELRGVARHSAVAMTRALGCLDIDENGPHRRETRRRGH